MAVGGSATKELPPGEKETEPSASVTWHRRDELKLRTATEHYTEGEGVFSQFKQN